MDELATMVAEYHAALKRRGLSEDLAAQLTRDWQQAVFGHANFAIMERNMGTEAYARYYTRVSTNVVKTTAREVSEAVGREMARFMGART